jgi:Reversibly glycosylated polypeptide
MEVSMALRAAMVLTTIADPVVLEGYCANFTAYGRLEQVQVIVIPDKKTPPTVFLRCAELRRKGLEVLCPPLDEQERILKRLGFPPELVPYDSDNRRNIGYLMAAESGADFLISIDDDNYCPANEDYFAEHSIVCLESRRHDVVESSSGWYNLCDLLELEPVCRVYPRGFPYAARHLEPKTKIQSRNAAVRINAGMWLLDPDLDGITWLAAPVRARSFRGKSIVLGDRTWSPVNTQNTALHRDVIPGYYFVPMGNSHTGLQIDRYGDIFSGYFSQACAKHLGHNIRAGTPVAVHRRNAHRYLRDATQEMAGICVLEDLLPWLVELRLDGQTYSEAYLSLSVQLEDCVSRFSGFIWTEMTRDYFHMMAASMRAWVAACRQLAAV